MCEPGVAAASPVAARPATARMLADVRAGLLAPHKSLPPTYFYDAAGSRLFDRITRLPEYYLTRAERALLEAHAHGIVRDVAPSAFRIAIVGC